MHGTSDSSRALVEGRLQVPLSQLNWLFCCSVQNPAKAQAAEALKALQGASVPKRGLEEFWKCFTVVVRDGEVVFRTSNQPSKELPGIAALVAHFKARYLGMLYIFDTQSMSFIVYVFGEAEDLLSGCLCQSFSSCCLKLPPL